MPWATKSTISSSVSSTCKSASISSVSFELSKDDPNFGAYAEGAQDASQPIHYYILQADKLRAEEKSTLFIDQQHISQY